MNNVLYTGLAMGMAYTGYYVVSWGYEKGKEYAKGYVMRKVKEELDKRLDGGENGEESSFKPTHTNSAVIRVSHGGKLETIYVPYDRRKSTSMLRKRVFLISIIPASLDDEDKECRVVRQDITQKPGVPYLVSASHLGGEKIVVENPEGEVIREYSAEEIPGYL